MKKSKLIKRALLTSILTLLMSVTCLIGTTFAWFTDTASTSVNKIQAGTLDVDIVDNNGNTLNGKTLNFKNVNKETDILWEPGATYNLDSFKIVNKGNLAFKYEVIVDGVNGNAKLLDVIDFTAKIGNTEVTLDNLKGAIVPSGKTAGTDEAAGETSLITISGTMKSTAGNEYQGLSIDGIAITVVATQYTYEYDSKDNQYDVNADTTIQVNKDNIQDYLDGKYGTIDGATLVLAAGNYDKLELGRATKYVGSNTQYRINSFDTDAMTIEEFLAANPSGGSNQVPYYTRTLSNITFKAAEGATVTINGIKMTSGKQTIDYAGAYDYVLDRQIVSGICYDLALKVYNIKFEGITFTSQCNIEAHDNLDNEHSDSVISGFTFDNCIFNIGTTADGNQAILYHDRFGKNVLSNLNVKNCTFNNCYQGVYTQNVKGVAVNNCTFDTTGHNAIAIQANAGIIFNHGSVAITSNTFNNINDRIIRFNNVGADTQITIKNNTATNSGDSDGQVIKATSLAAGITYDISGNSWGEGKTVANEELQDK